MRPNTKPYPLTVIADTGAQVTVAGPKHLKYFRLSIEELNTPTFNVTNAGGNNLTVLGSHPISILHNDQLIDTCIYFATGVNNVYISLETCKQLNLVSKTFPLNNIHTDVNNINTELPVNDIKESLPCKPASLPYAPTNENIPLLTEWFLNKFADSTFKTSDELKTMLVKPHKIHIKEDAVPFAAHTPIPTPHHWKKEVKDQLDRDVKLKVIRKVPIGEPTDWCMRMVVVPKRDGKPRRTVDFQPINKYCQRETHYTPSPFEAVSSIPTNVYKTVLDAYNGYHQIPLDTESIHLTTFITEFGRYQYLRSPQGHMASGDAYTRRFDDVIVDVPRKRKIVDDVLLYDTSIEQAFNHTFDFLVLCASHGVTMNPAKFKFAQQEVDYCGFTISWGKYRTAKDMLSAIQDFAMPEPPSITDIRSWFGLVNQLAPFLSTAPLMSPFRDLLKHKQPKKLYWDSNLQTIFESTKSELVKLAEKGLTFYDVNKKTVVLTDWSKLGVGFVILQKHCKCVSNNQETFCCSDGWKLALCNSRHLTNAELNCAPIEGEALGVCWALKKARIFLLGNNTFDIIVDHQPLLKIFGDKSLADIHNPRLLILKEKTLPYSFNMKYTVPYRYP